MPLCGTAFLPRNLVTIWVEEHLNPGCSNFQLQLRTFQTQTFQPWTFEPQTFQPLLFNPKSRVDKFRVGRFMVEKSRIEKPGIEMSFKLIVRGHFNPGLFNHELSNPGFFNPKSWVEKLMVEVSFNQIYPPDWISFRRSCLILGPRLDVHTDREAVMRLAGLETSQWM